jgi:hypothetical protein
MQTSCFAHSVLVVLRGKGIASVKSSAPACREAPPRYCSDTLVSDTPWPAM